MFGTVPSNLMWDDSHVKGKESLLKETDRLFASCPASTTFGARVIGVFGKPGIGKTTLCKSYCNHKHAEYKGKVLTVEVIEHGPKQTREKRILKSMRRVLRTMTGAGDLLLSDIYDIGRAIFALKERIPECDVFLAIDNVCHDWESKEEAKSYLTLGFTSASKVLVTSANRETLLDLGIAESCCFAAPTLEQKDAIDLFLQHGQVDKTLAELSPERQVYVLYHVNRCYFRSGVEREFHPYALKVLGDHCSQSMKHTGGRVDTNTSMQNDEKLQDLDRTILADAHCWPALIARGMRKLSMWDLPGALQDLKKSNELCPNDHWILMQLGVVKGLMGNYAGALIDLTRAYGLHRDQRERKLRERGVVQFRMWLDVQHRIPGFQEALKDFNLQGALEDFNESLTLCRNAWTFRLRGSVKHEMGDLPGALKDFDAACNLNKWQAWTWQLRGWLKLEMGDYKGARDDLKESDKLEPDITRTLPAEMVRRLRLWEHPTGFALLAACKDSTMSSYLRKW